MSNTVALTKRVSHEELVSELRVAGVVVGLSIDDTYIRCSGMAWDAMDAATQAAELALITATESVHAPTTITEVTLAAAPHVKKFLEECLAVTGVDNIGVEMPLSYPGVAALLHNSLDGTQQSNLSAAALAHDASSVPSLSVDTASQVIAADGVATGAVTVSDSRGAGASGNTVKLKIPPGGSAGADADSFVLDGSGQATVTFQATTTLTGELTFEFYYVSGEADPVLFTVRRGT